MHRSKYSNGLQIRESLAIHSQSGFYYSVAHGLGASIGDRTILFREDTDVCHTKQYAILLTILRGDTTKLFLALNAEICTLSPMPRAIPIMRSGRNDGIYSS